VPVLAKRIYFKYMIRHCQQVQVMGDALELDRR
jgi:hypothetical protein